MKCQKNYKPACRTCMNAACTCTRLQRPSSFNTGLVFLILGPHPAKHPSHTQQNIPRSHTPLEQPHTCSINMRTCSKCLEAGSSNKVIGSWGTAGVRQNMRPPRHRSPFCTAHTAASANSRRPQTRSGDLAAGRFLVRLWPRVNGRRRSATKLSVIDQTAMVLTRAWYTRSPMRS